MAVELPIQYDPLDEALASLRPRGAFLHRNDLVAPWTWGTGPGAGTTFHVVEHGRCELSVGDESLALSEGDLVVLPSGAAFSFSDGAGDAAGLRTVLLCAGVAFDGALPHPLLDALPPVFVVREALSGSPAGGGPDESPGLAGTLRLLSAESRGGRPGAATAMAHLAGAAFVQAVRSVLGDADAAPGWLAAIHDPHVGPALRAVQREPGRPWTVASLAREAGLSRSPFAARFRRTVGESPMRHVTRWRMHRAAQDLRAGATTAEVAARAGYESEAAFRRAFRRWTGGPPGRLRRAGGERGPAPGAGR